VSRIAPIERPFPPEFEAAMARTMPPGQEPLVLFTTLARSPRAWAKFAAGSLLDRGPLSLRHREIVIDRTAARCGCEYEWGVHVTGFGTKVGLTEEQTRATVAGGADDPALAPEEQVLVATVDALLDRKRLTDAEWAALRARFDEAQTLEIVQLVAFYHGVSLICGALDLPLEAGAARFPKQEPTYA
jgi:alkylhydroperoxidase family enzyme